MSRPRLEYLDVAKGIGILLVVYGHVARGLLKAGVWPDSEWVKTIDSVIYSFHMPLFFFCSGYVLLAALERHSLGRFLGSRLTVIAWPYMLWSVLHGLLELLLGRWTNGSVSLAQVLAFPWQPRAHFWFLYALFFISIFAALLYRYARGRMVWPVFLAGLALYLFPVSQAGGLIVGMFSAWFVFFAAGVACSWRSGAFLLRHPVWGLGFCLAVFAAGFAAGGGAEGFVFSLMAAFGGVGFVFCLSGVLSAGSLGRAFAFLGRRSMEIYLLHVIAASGARIVLSTVLGVQSPILHIVLGVLAGVFAPLVFAQLAEKAGVHFLFRWPIRRALK